MKRIFAILLMAFFVVPAFARTWTDKTGKFSVEAAIVECQGGVAYLKRDEGAIVPVPVARLSAADQEHILGVFPPASFIDGKVVSIADGDTLTVLDASKIQHKVRLEGIDCPESGQAYGAQAGKALGDKVFQKDVRIEWRSKDRYGRTLGHVFYEGRWINKELIEEGWAWHYKQYSRSEVLSQAEDAARAERAGLWQDKSPTAPWDFRHKPQEFEASVQAAPSESSNKEDPTVYVTKTGTKYHAAGCRHLAKSSIPIPLSEAQRSYSPCGVCGVNRLAAQQPRSASPDSVTSPAVSDASPSDSQSHWITSSSGVRHNSSCRYYRNSKGRPCGPGEGRACKICGG